MEKFNNIEQLKYFSENAKDIFERDGHEWVFFYENFSLKNQKTFQLILTIHKYPIFFFIWSKIYKRNVNCNRLYNGNINSWDNYIIIVFKVLIGIVLGLFIAEQYSYNFSDFYELIKQIFKNIQK